MICPQCGSTETRIIETDMRVDGVRRRRHKCIACAHRWTLFINPETPQVNVEGDNLPKQPGLRRLTPEDAEEVLMSECSTAALARKFTVSKEVIRRIRSHQTYQDVYKRLVLEGKIVGPKFCESCVHWSDGRGCDFGFPDAGGDFATDCYLFRQL